MRAHHTWAFSKVAFLVLVELSRGSQSVSQSVRSFLKLALSVRTKEVCTIFAKPRVVTMYLA